MRVGVAFLTVVLLQACASQVEAPPQDCEVARAQFDHCYDRYSSTGSDEEFEAMWYACVPHSEPMIIEGSWATDFEWNAFFEGREPAPEEAFPDYLPPNLAFKKGVEAPPGSKTHARLWSLKFVGRKETCRLFPEIPSTFFVEKIFEKKLIWEVEGYPSYSFE